MTLIELENVWKRYGREWVLRDISLSVDAGEVVALLGPNGVGKTTLLRVAATLTRPQKGAVRLFGKPARRIDAERGELLYLANPPAFYRHLSGEENLQSSLQLMGKPVLDGEIEAAMRAVGLAPGKPVSAYSSGMKKRLTMARIRLLKPKVLLLDEPETALDAEGREMLLALIDEVKRGGAVLLATHDREFARAVADREVVMRP